MQLISEVELTDGYSKSFAVLDEMRADKYTLSYTCASISSSSFITLYVTTASEQNTLIIPVQFAGDNSIDIQLPADTSLVEIAYKGSTIKNFSISSVVTPYMEFIKEKATGWDKINDVINNNNKLRADMIEGIINMALNSFANDSGTITQKNGIMQFLNGETIETSSEAMRLCAGGLEIASKKKADGSWDWDTAITGSGIKAEAIVAGTLMGMFISGGEISGTTIKGCTAQFGVPGYAYMDITYAGDIRGYFFDGDLKKHVPTVIMEKARDGRLFLGKNLNDKSSPNISIESVADIPFVSESVTEQAPQGSAISAGGEGLVIKHGDSYIIFWGGGIHIWPGGAMLNVHGDVFIDGQLEVSGGIIDNAH